MILKEIYLYPDLVEYSDEVIHPFRDQTRSICNFLERELGAEKVHAEGYKKICFVGRFSPDDKCFINSSKSLMVEVFFDEGKYKSLSKGDLNPFFSKMIVEGVLKCEGQLFVPKEILLNGLDKFEKNGFLNRWIFKKKVIKEFGITCVLECELTIDAFHLRLFIDKGGERVFAEEVLNTVPDEIVFEPMFREMKLIGSRLIILDKLGDELYGLPLDGLKL